MKKILILFFVLILVTGCGSKNNNGRKKLINVFEQNGFECTSEICNREYTNNGWKYDYIIDFTTYQYTYRSGFVDEINGITQTSVLTDNYNWKTNYLKSELFTTGYYEALVTGILDGDNEFSCSGGDEESCYGRKTSMLELKRVFSDWLAQANIELEDIK